ncbi:PepSY domain-containing protein [Phytohabitans kaempferiae]|uniref:PepSY domain-containing protein n=1 Tax=Phytohabitans kaempferiae TaxID=1620943 RepID=A0ABV6M2C4_9ACTN
MARKSLLVLVVGAAAAGIVATGAAAGAALTGGGPTESFGVAVSSTPSDDVTTPSDGSTPSDDNSTPSDDNSTPSGDPTSTGPADAVSLDQAIEIALGRSGGGTVVETEREWEHGRPAWKVEIVKGGVEHEVYVDRETGDIVKYDQDHDDDRGGSGRGDDDRDDDRGGKGRGGHDD